MEREKRPAQKCFQMRIQLAVSFSETWRKKNTHTHAHTRVHRNLFSSTAQPSYSLVPHSIFFHLILHPSWIARGQYHLSIPGCFIMPAHAHTSSRQTATQSAQCSWFIGIIHLRATCGTSYYAGSALAPIHFTGDGGVKYIFHNFICDNTNRSSLLPCYLHKLLNPLRRKTNTLAFSICIFFALASV